MEHVRCRVGLLGSHSMRRVDVKLHVLIQMDLSVRHTNRMKDCRTDRLSVEHLSLCVAARHHSPVADLSTAFGIERRDVEDNPNFFTRMG
jgi:hypothetical protein